MTVNGGIVGFFSLEMSAEQLATRIIAEQTGIPSNQIRRGGISEADFERIKDHSIELQNLPFFVDETGGLSVAQLAARARRLKRQRGLDLLVIDYLQLLQGSTRRSAENRVQEITEITTKLKALAKELNVPILALSQLSRQVESRDDKRPQLSDLRESGSIEQDADVVLFVFREEYYHQMRKPLESRPREVRRMAGGEAKRSTARPRSSSASSAMGRPAPSSCNSTAPITRFSTLAQGRPPAGAHRLALDARMDGPQRGRLNPSPWPKREPAIHQDVGRAGSTARGGASSSPRGPPAARGRRHPHHRSRRHRRQLARARPPRHAGECAAVVKADGYGCGIEQVAAALAKAGCKTFFVADLAEARRVRARRAASRRSMCSTACCRAPRAAFAELQRAAGDRQPGRARRMGRLLRRQQLARRRGAACRHRHEPARHLARTKRRRWRRASARRTTASRC